MSHKQYYEILASDNMIGSNVEFMDDNTLTMKYKSYNIKQGEVEVILEINGHEFTINSKDKSRKKSTVIETENYIYKIKGRDYKQNEEGVFVIFKVSKFIK